MKPILGYGMAPNRMFYRILARCRPCRRCLARLDYSSASACERDQLTPHTKHTSQTLSANIHKVLNTDSPLLKDISQYHFNGLGKAIRPTIVLAAADAFNRDSPNYDTLSHRESFAISRDQLIVSMVAEMIHTASLVHDDIIDESLFRRGNPSVFSRWGQTRGAYTGDYILSEASVSLSKLRHNRVMQTMSQILEDLVKGEFMQLGTKANEDDRFNHYIEKSYRKTASLLANSCQAAVVLSNTTEDKIKMAYEYGKNLGISFQLIDDALDYLSNEKEMGKPTGADLKLGLATAPVLFAAHEFPRLNALIMRRFARQGDVEEALQLVKQSSGLEQTRELAHRYGQEAIKIVKNLKESAASHALIQLVTDQLERTR